MNSQQNASFSRDYMFMNGFAPIRVNKGSGP